MQSASWRTVCLWWHGSCVSLQQPCSRSVQLGLACYICVMTCSLVQCAAHSTQSNRRLIILVANGLGTLDGCLHCSHLDRKHPNPISFHWPSEHIESGTFVYADFLWILLLAAYILQLLQEAMSEHLERGSSAFQTTTAARAALVGSIFSLRSICPPSVDAARASMGVLSGAMAGERVDELLQDLRQAEHAYDKLACLVDAFC
jgi:hypothetical protein